MVERKIGFVPNRPTRETRAKTFGNVTVVYTKEKKPNRVFLYNCECRREGQAAATGFHSDGRELSWEEIEEIPRFKELVASYVPGP